MVEQQPWWKRKWVIIAGVVLGVGLVGGVIEAVEGDEPEQVEEVAESSPAPEEDEEPSPAPESDPEEERTDEDKFLEAVYEAAREAGSGIHGKGDEWVVDLGWAVCEDIEGGMAPTEVVISLERANEGSRLDPVGPVASPLVGNAQIYLCPDV